MKFGPAYLYSVLICFFNFFQTNNIFDIIAFFIEIKNKKRTGSINIGNTSITMEKSKTKPKPKPKSKSKFK